MSDFDIRGEQAEPETPPVPALRPDDDPPARRLLAHDLEALVWDEDDDGGAQLPPPD